MSGCRARWIFTLCNSQSPRQGLSFACTNGEIFMKPLVLPPLAVHPRLPGICRPSAVRSCGDPCIGLDAGYSALMVARSCHSGSSCEEADHHVPRLQELPMSILAQVGDNVVIVAVGANGSLSTYWG